MKIWPIIKKMTTRTRVVVPFHPNWSIWSKVIHDFPKHRQTNRHPDTQTNRHTDKQTHRQTDTQTDTHKQITPLPYTGKGEKILPYFSILFTHYV